jgi:predicted nucleic acid-binding protein
MKILLDTNIFLEVILEQEHAPEARDLLCASSQYSAIMSDFSLHSIGLLLFRAHKHQVFSQLLEDIHRSGIDICSVHPEDLNMVIESAEKFGLDFDDAYQYTLAEKHNVVIVSFDSHFDATARGRKTPSQIKP